MSLSFLPLDPSQGEDLWWLFGNSFFKLNIFPFTESMKYNSVIFFRWLQGGAGGEGCFLQALAVKEVQPSKPY